MYVKRTSWQINVQSLKWRTINWTQIYLHEYLLLSIVLKFVILFWYCSLNSSMETFTSANMYRTINRQLLFVESAFNLVKKVNFSQLGEAPCQQPSLEHNKAKCCSRMLIKCYLYRSFSLSRNKKVNRKSFSG